MTKKSIDVQDEIEKTQTGKPVILKCSYKFAREIKKQRSSLVDPTIRDQLNQLTIKPVGCLPDHVVLLCNAKGGVIKMVNLSTRPKNKPIIIH